MNIFNKVFVIDDRYEEALPIIQALAIKGISSIYWNGDIDTKPEYPLNGVRLVILDMRFSYVTDSRTIITHLFTLLKSAISNENGPYILCVWSKHDNEYLEEFKKELIKQPSIPQPYLIINMEKSNFIKVTNQRNRIYDEMAIALDCEVGVETQKEIFEALQNLGIDETIETIETKENIFEELIHNLDEKLKEVNSLSILLIWENLANSSVNNLVNGIAQFSELDGTWDNNIKTLIQHLATANAGKSLGETPKEYILNALLSLNHMLPDELLNQLINWHIDEDKFNFINDPAIMKEVNNSVYSISKPSKKFIVKKDNEVYKTFKYMSDIERYEEEDRYVCKELYNKYLNFLGNSNFKLLCERIMSGDIKKPGSIYKVDDFELLKELSGFVFKDKNKINIKHNSLVKLDISSSCDYAQNKLKRVRVLFGIMIEDLYFSDINNTEDIYCTPELNIDGKNFKIAFNFHYITNECNDNLIQTDKLFSFRELLLTEIKHKLSTYISRVGIINL
ncbi:hypothetical protein [Marinisporobacter balticus]|uniref:Uncharacterized protein n=1 Tax=Marinisporobacter balticus TaxID=2018667 RepID=A0A4R2KYN8_9FIRM|nr:hypothetical protein [Marinisporobacter balticus]TCO71815.1 hypothetical protein EV214_12035 [Marinisporobacter balticus]